MSAYRRKGHWFADYYDEHGRRQRPALGETATTKKQAEEVERRLRVRVDEIRLGLASRDRNPRAYSVRQAVEWYLKGPAARQANAKSLGYTLRKHVTGSLAGMRIELVKAGDVAEWLDQREDDGDLAPRTVNRLRAYLMGAFTALIDRDLLVGDNPVRRVKKRAEEDPAPRLLPRAAVPVIINHAPSRAWRLVFILAAFQILRRAEIRRLCWHDIDLDRGTLLVRKAKSKKARMVPLHPEARAALEEAKRAGGAVIPAAAWGDAAIVTRAALERGGFKVPEGTQACFHSLRHTAATVAVECGADPWAIEWIAWGPRAGSTMAHSYLKPIDSLARELGKLRYTEAEVVTFEHRTQFGQRSGS